MVSHRNLAVILLGAVALGCSPDATTEPAESVITAEAEFHNVVGDRIPEVLQQLRAVREVTAPFRDIEVAQKDGGYTAQLTDCLEDPQLGAQGEHYGNVEVLDGTVELLRPEVLVYLPKPDGSRRLVSIEYIVPLDAWAEDDPPRLFGKDYHVNEEAGIYALHVWLWYYNPSGLFADWNPVLSCESSPQL